MGCTAGILDVLHGFRLDGLDVDFIKFLDEEFAVFSVDDGLYGSSQHLHIVFFECSGAEKFHTAVQCGLSAKGKHDALGAFLFDYTFYEIRCNGQEVYLVCYAFRGLYGGNVGVDQDGFDAFFLKRLETLASGIVEFAGFTDFKCSGTEEQNLGNSTFVYVVVGHCLCGG